MSAGSQSLTPVSNISNEKLLSALMGLDSHNLEALKRGTIPKSIEELLLRQLQNEKIQLNAIISASTTGMPSGLIITEKELTALLKGLKEAKISSEDVSFSTLPSEDNINERNFNRAVMAILDYLGQIAKSSIQDSGLDHVVKTLSNNFKGTKLEGLMESQATNKEKLNALASHLSVQARNVLSLFLSKLHILLYVLALQENAMELFTNVLSERLQDETAKKGVQTFKALFTDMSKIARETLSNETLTILSRSAVGENLRGLVQTLGQDHGTTDTKQLFTTLMLIPLVTDLLHHIGKLNREVEEVIRKHDVKTNVGLYRILTWVTNHYNDLIVKMKPEDAQYLSVLISAFNHLRGVMTSIIPVSTLGGCKACGNHLTNYAAFGETQHQSIGGYEFEDELMDQINGGCPKCGDMLHEVGDDEYERFTMAGGYSSYGGNGDREILDELDDTPGANEQVDYQRKIAFAPKVREYQHETFGRIGMGLEAESIKESIRKNVETLSEIKQALGTQYYSLQMKMRTLINEFRMELSKTYIRLDSNIATALTNLSVLFGRIMKHEQFKQIANDYVLDETSPISQNTIKYEVTIFTKIREQFKIITNFIQAQRGEDTTRVVGVGMNLISVIDEYLAFLTNTISKRLEQRGVKERLIKEPLYKVLGKTYKDISTIEGGYQGGRREEKTLRFIKPKHNVVRITSCGGRFGSRGGNKTEILTLQPLDQSGNELDEVVEIPSDVVNGQISDLDLDSDGSVKVKASSMPSSNVKLGGVISFPEVLVSRGGTKRLIRVRRAGKSRILKGITKHKITGGNISSTHGGAREDLDEPITGFDNISSDTFQEVLDENPNDCFEAECEGLLEPVNIGGDSFTPTLHGGFVKSKLRFLGGVDVMKTRRLMHGGAFDHLPTNVKYEDLSRDYRRMGTMIGYHNSIPVTDVKLSTDRMIERNKKMLGEFNKLWSKNHFTKINHYKKSAQVSLPVEKNLEKMRVMVVNNTLAISISNDFISRFKEDAKVVIKNIPGHKHRALPQMRRSEEIKHYHTGIKKILACLSTSSLLKWKNGTSPNVPQLQGLSNVNSYAEFEVLPNEPRQFNSDNCGGVSLKAFKEAYDRLMNIPDEGGRAIASRFINESISAFSANAYYPLSNKAVERLLEPMDDLFKVQRINMERLVEYVNKQNTKSTTNQTLILSMFKTLCDLTSGLCLEWTGTRRPATADLNSTLKDVPTIETEFESLQEFISALFGIRGNNRMQGQITNRYQYVYDSNTDSYGIMSNTLNKDSPYDLTRAPVTAEVTRRTLEYYLQATNNITEPNSYIAMEVSGSPIILKSAGPIGNTLVPLPNSTRPTRQEFVDSLLNDNIQTGRLLDDFNNTVPRPEGRGNNLSGPDALRVLVHGQYLYLKDAPIVDPELSNAEEVLPPMFYLRSTISHSYDPMFLNLFTQYNAINNSIFAMQVFFPVVQSFGIGIGENNPILNAVRFNALTIVGGMPVKSIHSVGVDEVRFPMLGGKKKGDDLNDLTLAEITEDKDGKLIIKPEIYKAAMVDNAEMINTLNGLEFDKWPNIYKNIAMHFGSTLGMNTVLRRLNYYHNTPGAKERFASAAKGEVKGGYAGGYSGGNALLGDGLMGSGLGNFIGASFGMGGASINKEDIKRKINCYVIMSYVLELLNRTRLSQMKASYTDFSLHDPNSGVRDVDANPERQVDQVITIMLHSTPDHAYHDLIQAIRDVAMDVIVKYEAFTSPEDKAFISIGEKVHPLDKGLMYKAYKELVKAIGMFKTPNMKDLLSKLIQELFSRGVPYPISQELTKLQNLQYEEFRTKELEEPEDHVLLQSNKVLDLEIQRYAPEGYLEEGIDKSQLARHGDIEEFLSKLFLTDKSVGGYGAYVFKIIDTFFNEMKKIYTTPVTSDKNEIDVFADKVIRDIQDRMSTQGGEVDDVLFEVLFDEMHKAEYIYTDPITVWVNSVQVMLVEYINIFKKVMYISMLNPRLLSQIIISCCNKKIKADKTLTTIDALKQIINAHTAFEHILESCFDDTNVNEMFKDFFNLTDFINKYFNPAIRVASMSEVPMFVQGLVPELATQMGNLYGNMEFDYNTTQLLDGMNLFLDLLNQQQFETARGLNDIKNNTGLLVNLLTNSLIPHAAYSLDLFRQLSGLVDGRMFEIKYRNNKPFMDVGPFINQFKTVLHNAIYLFDGIKSTISPQLYDKLFGPNTEPISRDNLIKLIGLIDKPLSGEIYVPVGKVIQSNINELLDKNLSDVSVFKFTGGVLSTSKYVSSVPFFASVIGRISPAMKRCDGYVDGMSKTFYDEMYDTLGKIGYPSTNVPQPAIPFEYTSWIASHTLTKIQDESGWLVSQITTSNLGVLNQAIMMLLGVFYEMRNDECLIFSKQWKEITNILEKFLKSTISDYTPTIWNLRELSSNIINQAPEYTSFTSALSRPYPHVEHLNVTKKNGQSIAVFAEPRQKVGDFILGLPQRGAVIFSSIADFLKSMEVWRNMTITQTQANRAPAKSVNIELNNMKGLDQSIVDRITAGLASVKVLFKTQKTEVNLINSLISKLTDDIQYSPATIEGINVLLSFMPHGTHLATQNTHFRHPHVELGRSQNGERPSHYRIDYVKTMVSNLTELVNDLDKYVSHCVKSISGGLKDNEYLTNTTYATSMFLTVPSCFDKLYNNTSTHPSDIGYTSVDPYGVNPLAILPGDAITKTTADSLSRITAQVGSAIGSNTTNFRTRMDVEFRTDDSARITPGSRNIENWEYKIKYWLDKLQGDVTVLKNTFNGLGLEYNTQYTSKPLEHEMSNVFGNGLGPSREFTEGRVKLWANDLALDDVVAGMRITFENVLTNLDDITGVKRFSNSGSLPEGENLFNMLQARYGQGTLDDLADPARAGNVKLWTDNITTVDRVNKIIREWARFVDGIGEFIQMIGPVLSANKHASTLVSYTTDTSGRTTITAVGARFTDDKTNNDVGLGNDVRQVFTMLKNPLVYSLSERNKALRVDFLNSKARDGKVVRLTNQDIRPYFLFNGVLVNPGPNFTNSHRDVVNAHRNVQTTVLECQKLIGQVTDIMNEQVGIETRGALSRVMDSTSTLTASIDGVVSNFRYVNPVTGVGKYIRELKTTKMLPLVPHQFTTSKTTCNNWTISGHSDVKTNSVIANVMFPLVRGLDDDKEVKGMMRKGIMNSISGMEVNGVIMNNMISTWTDVVSNAIVSRSAIMSRFVDPLTRTDGDSMIGKINAFRFINEGDYAEINYMIRSTKSSNYRYFDDDRFKVTEKIDEGLRTMTSIMMSKLVSTYNLIAPLNVSLLLSSISPCAPLTVMGLTGKNFITHWLGVALEDERKARSARDIMSLLMTDPNEPISFNEFMRTVLPIYHGLTGFNNGPIEPLNKVFGVDLPLIVFGNDLGKNINAGDTVNSSSVSGLTFMPRDVESWIRNSKPFLMSNKGLLKELVYLGDRPGEGGMRKVSMAFNQGVMAYMFHETIACRLYVQKILQGLVRDYVDATGSSTFIRDADGDQNRLKDLLRGY